VIARLQDGTLWVWSSIRLNPDLARSVDALGPVRHLVSPNRIHHLYLQDWLAAWPEAAVWGPQSTVDKRPDLPFPEPEELLPRPRPEAISSSGISAWASTPVS
jgi:hypothetical protein